MAFDGSRLSFYREKARSLREIAALCAIPDIQEQIERIARQYDTLAQFEENQPPR